MLCVWYTLSDASSDASSLIVFIFSVTAVSNLIANPPDQSTLCGHPIRYTSAVDVEFLDLGPCVLVVDGLPTEFSGVNQALKVYIGNVTKVKPLSCVVDGRQAVVKFEDDHGMQFAIDIN